MDALDEFRRHAALVDHEPGFHAGLGQVLHRERFQAHACRGLLPQVGREAVGVGFAAGLAEEAAPALEHGFGSADAGRSDLGAEPVFYLSVPMERPDVRDIFWEYALIKHGHTALLDHTRSESGTELDPEVVAALPAGAWILSGETPASVEAIAHLLDRGIVVDSTTVSDAGGRVLARIVRRAGA